MNLLLIDTDSCGLDIAYRASEAGHKVRHWIPKEGKVVSRDGFGFVGIERVDEWKPHMDWAKSGLIVNLYNGKVTKDLERYREYGFPVFGPSVKSAELEVKRQSGMQALEKEGVKVPPYKTFQTLQEAMAYAKKEDKRLVFKTLGDEEDKSLSYCAHDPDDMVWRINSWIEQGMTLKGPCMLQDFIEGIEVGVSAWMGSEGFLKPRNVNFEFKKLMSEDYGPATGEMGTVCKYVDESKLFTETLGPMEATLRKLGHLGDCDLNCIVTDHGPYCLEFTNRFGWPSTQILFASHKGDPIKWMKDALNGKDTLQTDPRTAIGVLMAAPPFPYPDEEGEAQGLRISGIEDEWQNVAPWQVELSEEGEYLSTGPYVCLATALGSDVHDCIPNVYATCDRIKFPNRIVRSDIGKRLEKQIPELKALGYDEMPDY